MSDAASTANTLRLGNALFRLAQSARVGGPHSFSADGEWSLHIHPMDWRTLAEGLPEMLRYDIQPRPGQRARLFGFLVVEDELTALGRPHIRVEVPQ